MSSTLMYYIRRHITTTMPLASRAFDRVESPSQERETERTKTKSAPAMLSLFLSSWILL